MEGADISSKIECLSLISRTQVISDRCKFKWIVENFTMCEKSFLNVLYSSNFYTSDKKELEWRLTLYPYGSSNSYEGFLSVFINMTSSNVVKACCQISVLNKNNEKVNTATLTEVLNSTSPVGFINFIRRDILLDKKNDLLPNGTLTLLCELQTTRSSSDVKNSGTIRAKDNFSGIKRTLCDDFSDFYKSLVIPDFTIKVGDKEFKVHKAILAARSSVFLAMFEHQMQETETNFLEINDRDPAVMEEVLRFIYTDGCTNLNTMAAEILPVADYYNLERLRERCIECLIDSLTVDNSTSTLILADYHNLSPLKSQGIKFINLHGKEVVNSKGWDALSNHPSLALEVYTAMFGCSKSQFEKNN